MEDLLEISDENQAGNRKEIDLWLIRDNLKLSYEARVAQHQNTLDCISELKQIGLATRENLRKDIAIGIKQADH